MAVNRTTRNDRIEESDRRFWRSAQLWPADPAEHIFLPRAIHKLGAAMFGRDWTGEEPGLDVIEPLMADKSRAVFFLREFDSEYIAKRKATEAEWEMQASPDQSRGPCPVAPLTRDEFLAAQEYVRSEIDSQRPALQRRDDVELEIVKRCESGELIATTRAIEGGPMKVVPKVAWNTDRWRYRFVLCQMNPSAPYERKFTSSQHCWVFVTDESLEKLLSTKPSAKIGSKDVSRFSPYVRTLLVVAKELAISPSNQPKKEEVITAILDRWPGKPLSKRVLNAMATILREPESQLGRARKKIRPVSIGKG